MIPEIVKSSYVISTEGRDLIPKKLKISPFGRDDKGK